MGGADGQAGCRVVESGWGRWAGGAVGWLRVGGADGFG